MDNKERREAILKLLQSKTTFIPGSEIAEMMGVTRQVIIRDIALLRASGHNIIATSKGYALRRGKGVRAIFAVKHVEEEIEEELTLIVQKGGRVLDVVVEHPLYGEIRGNLKVETLEDVKRFLAKMKTASAKPLLTLSEGIHLHTVEADDWKTLEMIKEDLEKEGFLLTD